MSFSGTILGSNPLFYFRLHQSSASLTDTCLVTNTTGNLHTGSAATSPASPQGTILSATQAGCKFVSSSHTYFSQSWRYIQDFTSSLYTSGANYPGFVIPQTASLDFNISSTFSISWFMRVVTGTGTGEYLGRYGVWGGIGTGMLLWVDNSNIITGYYWWSGSLPTRGNVNVYHDGITKLQDLQWHHFVWTYSGSSSTNPGLGTTLWIDGARLSGSITTNVTPANWALANFVTGSTVNMMWKIGSTHEVNGSYIPRGELYSEWAIWNRVLDGNEIVGIYQNSFLGVSSTDSATLSASIVLTSSYDIQRSAALVQRLTTLVSSSTSTGAGGFNSKINRGTN